MEASDLAEFESAEERQDEPLGGLLVAPAGRLAEARDGEVVREEVGDGEARWCERGVAEPELGFLLGQLLLRARRDAHLLALAGRRIEDPDALGVAAAAPLSHAAPHSAVPLVRRETARRPAR